MDGVPEAGYRVCMGADQPQESLDTAVIRLWRIQTAITLVIIGTVALIPVGTLTLAGKIPSIIPLCLILAGLTAVLVFTLWFVRVAFRGWGYRVDKGAVEIRRGVVFTREIHVPLGRVQHVDIEQGPLERRHGLARLILFTAGTKAARQVIPGLRREVAEALRGELTRAANHRHPHA